MSWYKVAVDKFIKQYYKELISTVLFIALLIIYHLIFGDKFESELSVSYLIQDLHYGC